MINFRVIARIFSLLLIFEGLFMLFSAHVSLVYGEDSSSAFFYSALITTITGALVFTPLRNEEKVYGNKEGYIIVTGSWILFSLFGTLPYLFSGSVSSFTDAFFETVSGVTTTGATILRDVESLPKGILFWRSLTQWIGGIGVIFISLSVFTVIKSLNIQVAVTEFAGHQADRIHPRIKDASIRLIAIFAILTGVEVILLLIGGMPFFDAVCHSMSTMSTGGFSTRNDGIASFSSPYIMIIITLFMFLAGTNMTLVYFGFKGNLKKIRTNNEFIFYTVTCVSFIAVAAVILLNITGDSFGRVLLNSSFHIVSIITTTGFYTQNYTLWGNLLIMVIFLLMFTGGTSGSSSGGIKIARLLLITRNNRHELRRLVHPSGFIPVKLDKHVVSQNTIHNLLVFLSLYFLVFCAGSFVVSFLGYDLITSFSTSASMLGNIGPALGKFGPFTNYSEFSVGGKWVLSFLMIVGRLELFTVLILFTRNFYSR